MLVAASSPVARAGLKTMVAEECGIAGSSDSANLVGQALELHPDVVLWQLSPDEDPCPALQALAGIPVAVLTDQPATDLLRAGARAVLPYDVTSEQLGAAIRAIAADLVVTMPQRKLRSATSLSGRETEVLRMIGEGLANKEIAWRLGISEHTVKFHVSAVLAKLGAGTRAEAIRVGIRQGAILV